jgi:hypothetical protein
MKECVQNLKPILKTAAGQTELEDMLEVLLIFGRLRGKQAVNPCGKMLSRNVGKSIISEVKDAPEQLRKSND